MTLLVVLVGFGLAVFVVLAFMHGGTSRPTPQAPVSDRRMRRLWIVEEHEDERA